MSYLLDINRVALSHDDRTVVNDLSFGVPKGSLSCLLGPSGCGKTSVLRAIAGFHPVDHGEIALAGRVVSRPGYRLAPEARKVGMVFQDHALFPHLKVFDNIAFGIRTARAEQKRQKVHELLEKIGLIDIAERYPHELSGGQNQRVALARALAPKPDLLLMDEPFSNLDLELRERLGHDVRDILKDEGMTCVMVTHDQFDAFALSDKVGVMAEGGIRQWDTPYNLYHEPADRFVADFIGDGVLLPGTLLRPDTVETELGVIQGERRYSWGEGSQIDVLIRPDDIVPDPQSTLQAVIVRKAFKGAEILYTLRLRSGALLLSLFPSHVNHGLGEEVGIRLQADHLVAFPRRTELV